MKKTRMKYFSFDKIPYLYEGFDDEELSGDGKSELEDNLKIAG